MAAKRWRQLNTSGKALMQRRLCGEYLSSLEGSCIPVVDQEYPTPGGFAQADQQMRSEWEARLTLARSDIMSSDW